MGDHAVFYIVCGCPLLVFLRPASTVLARRFLTFLISLEANFRGSTDPFQKRHNYVRTVTTKRDNGHHWLHYWVITVNLMLQPISKYHHSASLKKQSSLVNNWTGTRENDKDEKSFPFSVPFVSVLNHLPLNVRPTGLTEWHSLWSRQPDTLSDRKL